MVAKYKHTAMAKYKHTTILRLCSPTLPSDMTLDVYTDGQKRTPIIQTHMLMDMPFRKGISIPGELIPIRPPPCTMKANDCDCIHIGTGYIRVTISRYTNDTAQTDTYVPTTQTLFTLDQCTYPEMYSHTDTHNRDVEPNHFQIYRCILLFRSYVGQRHRSTSNDNLNTPCVQQDVPMFSKTKLSQFPDVCWCKSITIILKSPCVADLSCLFA